MVLEKRKDPVPLQILADPESPKVEDPIGSGIMIH
jgi:hypothetical protein